MSIDLRQFHESFFSESFAGLDATEANLLRLEAGERSPELLNAIFRAIQSATETECELAQYTVEAVTGGEDALGEVTVMLRVSGRLATGHSFT